MSDGPRALRDDEWPQLDALVSAVFRPSMFQNYPQLFDRANRANLRVVAEDGKVVTHVGMTQRAASLQGCRIDVACIGAVATYDAYRGRGFASAAFQDCCDKAAADGVDVMLISGGRGLYTRVGCRQVGRDYDVALERETAGVLSADGCDLVACGPDDVPALRAIHAQEGVRFIRPRDDWRWFFASRVAMNTPADLWGVRRGGALQAYLLVHQPDKIRRRAPGDPTTARIVEYAGDRTAVAAGMRLLLETYPVDRATIHAGGHDAVLRAVLESNGLSGTPAGASGTLRVINFPQLMERCRPLLAARAGSEVAAALRFEAHERPGSALGGFTIRLGAATLRLPDLAGLAQYLFGSTKPLDVEPTGDAGLTALMQEVLPLPTLWYGINYV
jgi:predicted N-acetyltransferase YhbS